MDYFLKADFGMGMTQVTTIGHKYNVSGRARNLTEARKQAIDLLNRHIFVGVLGHGGHYENLIISGKVYISHFGKNVGYVQRRSARDPYNKSATHVQFSWHPVEGTARGLYTDGSLKPIERVSDNLFPKLMFPTL